MNEKYMKLAFLEAKKAYDCGEVPIGTVIVKNEKVLAKAHNLKEKYQCAIYHAEMLAIKKASKKINNWRLDGCDIYITLEPCPMCASAIKQARIQNIYCALSNTDENTKLLEKILAKDHINPKVNLYNNLFSESGKKILKDFFNKRRKK